MATSKSGLSTSQTSRQNNTIFPLYTVFLMPCARLFSAFTNPLEIFEGICFFFQLAHIPGTFHVFAGNDPTQ